MGRTPMGWQISVQPPNGASEADYIGGSDRSVDAAAWFETKKHPRHITVTTGAWTLALSMFGTHHTAR